MVCGCTGQEGAQADGSMRSLALWAMNARETTPWELGSPVVEEASEGDLGMEPCT